MKENYCIIFEGIDGSGKTTIINALHERLGFKKFTTPVNDHLYITARKYLAKDMSDTEKNAFALLMAEDKLLGLANNGILTETLKNESILIDRFIDSFEVYNQDFLPTEVFRTLKDVIDKLMERLPQRILSVYMVITPEEAKKRIATSRTQLEFFDDKQESAYVAYEKIITRTIKQEIYTDISKEEIERLYDTNGYFVYPIPRLHQPLSLDPVVDVGLVIDATQPVEGIIDIFVNLLNRLDK